MIPFSVLMSVYKNDKPEELVCALESIWHKQSQKPNEIVIVKDGPVSQEITSVLDDFSKCAPVKFWTLEKNQGLGEALKCGLAICSNKYVARMDSDDISHPDRFKKQLAYIGSHPGIQILGTGSEEFLEEPNQAHATLLLPQEQDAIYHYSKKRSPFNHGSVVLDRDFILAIGNYEKFEKYEDYWLWIRAIKNHVVCANMPDILYSFRVGVDMLKRRRGIALFNAELKLIRRMVEMKFISPLEALLLIPQRALPRLLPVSILKLVYAWLRRH